MNTIRRARRNVAIGLEPREGKECLSRRRTVSSQPLFTRPDRGKTRRRALLMSRVGLEPLEDRCLMSSFHWASDVSGDFNSAANWVDQSDNPGRPRPERRRDDRLLRRHRHVEPEQHRWKPERRGGLH